MKRLLSVLMLLACVAAQANPFDPSGYIQQNEVQKGELKILSTEIYQINRKRFMKFVATQGSVVFPSPMEAAEIQEHLGLCGYHLKAFDEVLMIRKGLPVPKLTAAEQKIVMDLLARCLEGSVKGPTKTVETHDGVSVTIEPTKDDEIKSTDSVPAVKDNGSKSRAAPHQK